MKKPTQNEQETVQSDELLLRRSHALRTEMKARMGSSLSSITLAQAAALGRDALRGFLERTVVEPSVFKIADAAAILGCSVDELLVSGNKLRNAEFPSLFTTPRKEKFNGSQDDGCENNNVEGEMANDPMFQFVVEKWSRMDKTQRYDLLNKIQEIAGSDQAEPRFQRELYT